MSGSISVGPLAPLVSHTAVPLHTPVHPPDTAGPGPDGTAFRSLLAGSPAPTVTASPSPCLDGSGCSRMAELAPTASGLPVAPGPQAAGRTLAVTDVSMAGWSASSSGATAATAASAAQVDAVRPVAHAAFSATSRLLTAFP
ncbi:MAG: hypothetical protein ACOVK6_07285 [Ramlibacter sp.]|jgi:hypothetical protein